MVPLDISRVIGTYLAYDDLRALECATRAFGSPARERRNRAGRLVTSVVRRVIAERRMILYFFSRCAEEPAFRDTHLYIHMIPQPHVCFRRWPRWLARSTLRQDLVRIVEQHARIAPVFRAWNEEHGIVI